MKIFLAPRSNETAYKNFLSTIEHGVDYSVVEPHLETEGIKILSKKGKIFAWGTKETIKSSWEKMQNGDLVLFYKGRESDEQEGKFMYVGKLVYKQNSKDLGLALWPPKPGQDPWTCIFFLDELKDIYIPISEINKFAGYNKNFVVQGFMPLNEKGIKNILNKFHSFENFIHHYVKSTKEIVEELDELSEIKGHTDAEILLLKIGQLLEYETYSPDRSKMAFGEPLSDYCSLEYIPTSD